MQLAKRVGSIATLAAVAVSLGSAISCSSGSAPTANISTESGGSGPSAAASASPSAPSPAELGKGSAPRPTATPIVLIKTSLGDLKVKLNPEAAPLTVENFLENYVDRGFYAETIFHHVEPGFIVAGGFGTDMQAKPARAPILNESHNGLKNKRGTVAMARSPEYSDSATSQFFINIADDPALDYDDESDTAGYCVFGEIVEGLEIADSIAAVTVGERDGFPRLPVQQVVIRSIERVSAD